MRLVQSLPDRQFPPLAVRARLRWGVVAPIYDDLAPARVLEVGCGQGGFGARFAATSDYVGVELDETSARVAESRIRPHGGQVLVTDYTTTDLGDFDLVCAFEVVEHLEDDLAAVRDMAARLRPGGHLLLSVPAFQDRYSAVDVRVGHYRRYDPGQLAAVCSAAGLEDARETLYAWPLGYALETVVKRLDARQPAVSAGTTAQELTATSGRLRQPGRTASGQVIRFASAPFAALQKMQPRRGTGVVVTARRPA